MKREKRNKELEDIKNVIIVIDMVKGFVEEGNLAAPSIKRVVPRQKELLEKYDRDNNSLVVFVRDTHDNGSIEFKTYGIHCLRGTNETELIDELNSYKDGAIDFEKNSTNFLLAPGVIDFFNKCINLEKVSFVGCLSEVCVKNAAISTRNYFDQVNRDVEVGVYEDAIDTFNAPGHDADLINKKAIDDMKSNGVVIYKGKELNKKKYPRLARNYTLMSDEYEFTMANGYLKNHKENDEAVFDMFFRKVPNNGGYAVMAGVDKIIPYIENLRFGEQELDYYRRCGYPEEFINYLKNFKFHGDIYAIPDGTPVFPNEPLVTVKAPLIEAQILETALLSIVNGAMEHATGARRVIEAANGVPVMEFGARRADGCEAAIDSSIYGIMAGCVGTSNILAADMLNLKAMGTMAHSWIESYDNELDAFIAYAKAYPNNCILLVDTVDTLRSGIPNAIKTFEYMKANSMDVSHIGVRIDSGDLAYLSKETRKMLDAAGFTQAKIYV